MTRKSTRLLYLIPFVLVFMFLGPWILMSMAFFADEAIRYLLPERRPVFGNVELRVTNNCVEIVSFPDRPEPLKFFFPIGSQTVEFAKLDITKLTSIGFTKSKYTDSYFLHGDGFSPNDASSAEFLAGSLKSLDICTTNLSFASNPDGPFLKVGCTFDEFKAQFGKPTSWRSIRRTSSFGP